MFINLPTSCQTNSPRMKSQINQTRIWTMYPILAVAFITCVLGNLNMPSCTGRVNRIVNCYSRVYLCCITSRVVNNNTQSIICIIFISLFVLLRLRRHLFFLADQSLRAMFIFQWSSVSLALAPGCFEAVYFFIGPPSTAKLLGFRIFSNLL